ncbi:CRISPR-associated helicase Cas3' [Paenibacillus sp. GSMTC-2017]|uniref:CRISPR-associated helicase Cas3' n=1 Tax=Paenibacillus sp. GSMTC-2017 TaxID=2794350 RepID=UPI0018D722A1|nr:CRISPR-associated helicase Cas3' [Paenibacillus sp. GSMTC-2017]MBH5316966.1 CRISPR-associated helicase Cas3' [Paenibacillus sp. GSMTC-2017]
MDYFAHIRGKDKAIQSVEEHLLGVKKLAESYGEKIGVKHIAGLAGLLHDMGKFTAEFRKYILDAVNSPDNPPRRGSVDHSTAGGKLLFELYHNEPNPSLKWILAEVVGNVIISHHSYLHDFLNPDLESDYLKRVFEKELKFYEEAKKNFFDAVVSEDELRQYVQKALTELESFMLKPSTESQESKLMFLTKFIFSALIDADRTNTRLFEENKSIEPPVESSKLFQDYYGKLMNKINSFKEHKDANSTINLLRKQMSDRCDEFAMKTPSIYKLSIPTGGGKTLASFRYALKHAMEFGKKRIIYVVPFTTIIEQNAEEIRKIIQDDASLLEHHSNVINDTEDDEDIDGILNKSQKLKLAKDNWDAPIIFTTMVQFLNVFYERGSRNIRRMHNLSESVIIFDEVQKVPVPCVSLFNYAVNFLKIYGQSTLILCTATQPTLDFVEHKLELEAESEIINHLDQIIESFTRVEIIDRATDETFTNEKLVQFVEEKIEEVGSVLVILNTKSVVKRLYELLRSSEDVSIYHLSTAMCAAHRNDILGKVREHLAREEKVVCISTQLIEAGVDVSFKCVIRSLAGLDSIAQAAGRCNRHGEWDIQYVYVIDHEEENLKHLKEIRIGKEISKKLLIDIKQDRNNHGGHVLSVDAMKQYFQRFYNQLKSNLNYPISKLERDMTELLLANRKDSSFYLANKYENGTALPLFIINSYRTAADHFQVIDNYTTAVIAPYGEEGKDIIAKLNGSETIENLTKLLRSSQQYTINLLPYEIQKLTQNNGLVSLFDGKVWALKESAYSDRFGVDIENESGFEGGFF